MTELAYKKGLNSIHLPNDAGEYSEGLLKIMNRIPKGWGRWISCSKGWYKIICDLDKQISQIYPDYEVHQVKEKYGSLRYYCSYDGDKKISELIDNAEALALKTCERCGAPGELCKTKAFYPWYQTLCHECAGEQYLNLQDWDIWWETEKPKFEAAEKERKIKQRNNWIEKHSKLKIIHAGGDRELAVPAYRPTTTLDAHLAAYDNWDEIFIGGDEIGQAFVIGLKERFADYIEEKAIPEELKGVEITSLSLNKIDLSPLFSLGLTIHGRMDYQFADYNTEK